MATCCCCSCFRVPIRLLIVVSTCLIMFSISDNMSITIVSMVTPMVPVNGSQSSMCPSNTSSSFSVWTQSPLHFPPTEGNQIAFPWSSEMQGVILGCYYWSFVLVLVPFGYICDQFGGAPMLNTCILLSGILYVVTPFAAVKSVWLLILMRTLLGSCQAGVNVSSYVLMCKWLPIHERSVGISLIANVGNVSNIMFLLTAGRIMDAFSWEGMFYIPGIMSLVTFVIVAPVIRSEPEKHACITRAEVCVIRDTEILVQQEEEDEERLVPVISESEDHHDPASATRAAVPWVRMFTNPAVLSLVIWKVTSSLSSFIITSESPTYLSRVYHLSVSEIGVISSIANSLYVMGCILFAKISEVLIQKDLITRTNCRKVFSLFAGSGVALTSLLSLARCNKDVTMSLLFTNYLMQSCYVATDLTLPAEMTTRYQGVLFSVMNIASMAPGFLGPMYTGFVLQQVEDQWTGWDVILVSTASALVLANAVFLVYASAKVQDFDREVDEESIEGHSTDSQEQEGHHVIS